MRLTSRRYEKEEEKKNKAGKKKIHTHTETTKKQLHKEIKTSNKLKKKNGIRQKAIHSCLVNSAQF